MWNFLRRFKKLFEGKQQRKQQQQMSNELFF